MYVSKYSYIPCSILLKAGGCTMDCFFSEQKDLGSGFVLGE